MSSAGGGENNAVFGDVWRSGNGAVWVSVAPASPSFVPRYSHQAVSHEGSLWVMGGYDGSDFYGDVWRSLDGSVWGSGCR